MSIFNKPQSTIDPGFGTRATQGGSRMMNADGSFNVRRSGLTLWDSINPYHSLINMSWKKFISIVLVLYFLINTFYAVIYYILGMHHLAGVIAESKVEQFWEAFFFSAQTLTTVGYGRISPVGVPANIVASIESMTGLLGFALITGLLYGRFSRPNAKLLFSKTGVVAPYKNITGLMFRTANARENQLIEGEAQMMLSWVVTDDKGNRSRAFYSLPLERNKITFLALSWTVVHPIDENSVLYGVTQEELAAKEAEFILIIKAFDDTFNQTVHSRSSYKYNEIVFGAKFISMYTNDDGGGSLLELDKIGTYDLVPLPAPIALENR